jgi:hypothetical protein
MTLSCPREFLGVTVSVGVGNPQMGLDVYRVETVAGCATGGKRWIRTPSNC